MIISPPPAAVLRQYASGDWHGPDRASAATVTSLLGVIHFLPRMVREGFAIDQIGCNITAIGTAANIRMGIYSSVGNRPAALLAQTADLAISATDSNAGAITGGAVFLPAGLYWDAYAQWGTAAATMTAIANSDGIAMATVGGSNAKNALAAGSAFVGWRSTASTYAGGALPSTAPAISGYQSGIGLLAVRVA